MVYVVKEDGIIGVVQALRKGHPLRIGRPGNGIAQPTAMAYIPIRITSDRHVSAFHIKD